MSNAKPSCAIFRFASDGSLVEIHQDRALELPKEHEMPAKDKYTVFSPRAEGYRKSIHKVPKWTRVCNLGRGTRAPADSFRPAHTQDEPERLLKIFCVITISMVAKRTQAALVPP